MRDALLILLVLAVIFVAWAAWACSGHLRTIAALLALQNIHYGVNGTFTPPEPPPTTDTGKDSL